MKTKYIIPVLLVGFLSLSKLAISQAERMQAAIIYQATRLIDWSQAAKQEHFIIGVLADNQTTLNELSVLNGRRVANQIIEVVKLTSIDEVKNANIVYVSRARANELQTIVRLAETSGTFVVVDKPGAVNLGAAISFVEDEGKVHFEINRSNAERNSLVINNNLYKLARNVF